MRAVAVLHHVTSNFNDWSWGEDRTKYIHRLRTIDKEA